MPDVFVPWDSTKYTDFYVDLLSKGVFNDFVLEYIDKERKSLNRKYTSFDRFNELFTADYLLLEDFLRLAKKKDILPGDNEFEISKELIQYQLKALIARNLFDFNSYFQIMTQIDEGYLKANEVMGNDSFFAELIKK